MGVALPGPVAEGLNKTNQFGRNCCGRKHHTHRRRLQGVITPVALELQAAQQAAAPLQRLGGGAVWIDQLQRLPRRFCRYLARNPVPVANRLDGLIQAGQRALERRQRAPAVALAAAPRCEQCRLDILSS
jgi:hypothetical protein